MPPENCNMCGRPGALDVISSGIAPVSGALCRECQEHGAEALGVVHFWIVEYGSPNSVPELSKQIVSYYDGAYISWPKIEHLFRAWEERITKDFYSEFEEERP